MAFFNLNQKTLTTHLVQWPYWGMADNVIEWLTNLFCLMKRVPVPCSFLQHTNTQQKAHPFQKGVGLLLCARKALYFLRRCWILRTT